MTRSNPTLCSEISSELLISHIGHDFNNLFSIIIGGLSLLRDEIPTEAWNEELQVTYEDILSATRDATTLVDQLNSWAGRQLLNPTTTELNQLLQDLEAVLEYGLCRNLRLDLDLHPQPLPAFIDSEALQQCLVLLMSNARDALPEGGHLEIRSRPGPRIEIQDHGEGMSSETLRRCTEPFFTTRKTSGRQGLGLAVASGFVRASGGQLEIQSEPGTGTQISLALPAPENS